MFVFGIENEDVGAATTAIFGAGVGNDSDGQAAEVFVHADGAKLLGVTQVFQIEG